MMKLELTELAKEDIRDIASHGRMTHGEQQTEIYIQGIYERLVMLTDFPDIGHVRSDIPAGYKAIKVAASHIAIYRTQGDTVYIVRILYSGMDFDQQMH